MGDLNLFNYTENTIQLLAQDKDNDILIPPPANVAKEPFPVNST